MATDERSPLPPLPKPKYGLLKPQPLNYQKVSDPAAADSTSQKARPHPDMLPTDHQPENAVHPVQPVDPHAVVPGEDIETDADVPEYDEMSEPEEVSEAEGEQANAVVLGTGINQATNRRETVTIGDVERRGGVYIVGQPRTGKSTLLINLILQDSAHGHGLCFIDPHGDAIEEVIKQLPDDRLDDVILLDPLDEAYTVGFNLFACQDPRSKKQISRTINYVLQVFGKLFTESGDLQDAVTLYDTLLNTIILLVYNQAYTLAEVPLLLVNRDAAAKLIEQIGYAHDDEKEWWLEYNRLKFAEKNEVSGSTRRRLRTFLTDEHIRHIVGQARSTLDFRDIMDTGKSCW
jgi:hypothetical protein